MMQHIYVIAIKSQGRYEFLFLRQRGFSKTFAFSFTFCVIT